MAVTPTQVKEFLTKKANFIPVSGGAIGVTDITDSSAGMQRYLTLNNKVIPNIRPINAYYLADSTQQDSFYNVIANKLNQALAL
jgi:hypothetical protein